MVGDTEGVLSQMHRMFAQSARIGWGRDDPWFRQLLTSRFMPSGNKELWQAFNDLQRRTTRPETAVRVFDLGGSLDVSALTALVSAPTLVLHGRDDQVIPFETGRRLALLLPDSRFVPMDTDNHILLSDEPAWPVCFAEQSQGAPPLRSPALCGAATLEDDVVDRPGGEQRAHRQPALAGADHHHNGA